MGIKVIWVESDSLSAMKTINNDQPFSQKATSCLKDIWELLRKFEKYKVSHAWRETNRATDHLAKMVLFESDYMVLFPHDFPNDLCKIMKDDSE
jgi:ribonuclease HI